MLSKKKKYFNYRASRGKMVTEGAFGKLNGNGAFYLENVKVKKKM